MTSFYLKILTTGSEIEVDNEGYLLNPADWEIHVAEQIAENENIQLQSEHWTVVKFVRQYYDQNQVVPGARFVLRELEKTYGKSNATRKALYSLFPYGYGQQACKIAGMRKPLKLMLDV